MMLRIFSLTLSAETSVPCPPRKLDVKCLQRTLLQQNAVITLEAKAP